MAFLKEVGPMLVRRPQKPIPGPISKEAREWASQSHCWENCQPGPFLPFCLFLTTSRISLTKQNKTKHRPRIHPQKSEQGVAGGASIYSQAGETGSPGAWWVEGVTKKGEQDESGAPTGEGEEEKGWGEKRVPAGTWLAPPIPTVPVSAREFSSGFTASQK